MLTAVSVSVNLNMKLHVYLCLKDINKYIYIESEVSTFKYTNSNEIQIFSDYVIRMKHAYRCINTMAMMSQCCRVHLTELLTSVKPKTKKALVYQIIKMLTQPPYCFSLTHSLLLLVLWQALCVCLSTY